MKYRDLLYVLNLMSETELDKLVIVTDEALPTDQSAYWVVRGTVQTECLNPMTQNQTVLTTFH